MTDRGSENQMKKGCRIDRASGRSEGGKESCKKAEKLKASKLGDNS
jgi:hypothetical protein